jgi:hypothetical protein
MGRNPKTNLMKKIFILAFVLSIFPFLASFSQEAEQDIMKSTKKDQRMLYNNVNFAYGIGSLYIFTSEVNHSYSYDNYYYSGPRSDINSIGAFMLGYDRMVSKVVMVGFVASYINVHYTRVYTSTGGGYQGKATFNDNLLNGIARITFNYVNKPSVRVYSSVGMGITVDLSNVEAPGIEEESDRKILPAGQVTFMGVRFGRSFGGFCEFGIGTNSIISAGLNYQFGD